LRTEIKESVCSQTTLGSAYAALLNAALNFASASLQTEVMELSERSKYEAQCDHHSERYDRTDDRDDHDVEITLAVSFPTDRQQRQHAAVMGQAVKRSGADHSHAVHECRIDAIFRGQLHVGAAKCIQRNLPFPPELNR
jgi:hypothetical protein